MIWRSCSSRWGKACLPTRRVPKPNRTWSSPVEYPIRYIAAVTTPQHAHRISTDEVKVSRFAPHGLVEISFLGDILLYTATGPFNKELVESLAVAQMEILTAADHHGPWVSVSLMRNSLLASPEAFARYSEMMHVAKSAQFTPLASAYVVAPDVEGRALMLSKYAEIHTSCGLLFRSFELLDEALEWAQTLIAAESEKTHTTRSGWREPPHKDA